LIEFHLIVFHRAWRICARNGPIDGSVVPYMETSAQYREFNNANGWLLEPRPSTIEVF
jgi:hypothetical protein